MSDIRVNIFVGDERLDDAIFALLSRLDVRESDRQRSVARLRFALVQGSSGEFSPVDDEVFEPAARLRVELTAPAAEPVHLFDGYVSHLRPHFESILSNCYLEVIATDAALLLDAVEHVASYPDMSDSEVVEEIFGRHQIPVTAEPTEARLDSERQLLIQRGTDWQFVQRLARRNGYCVYLEPDAAGQGVQAYFQPPAYQADTQPQLSIIGDDENVAWIDVQLRADRPVEYAGAAIDPVEKRLLSSHGADGAAPLGGTDFADWVGSRFEDAGASRPSGLLQAPLVPQEALEAQVEAAGERARRRVELRGEVVAQRYQRLLRARRPVLVKGVGRLLAGAYYVESVRTVLEEGALTQTFVASRDAIELRGDEEFGKSDDEVVTK